MTMTMTMTIIKFTMILTFLASAVAFQSSNGVVRRSIIRKEQPMDYTRVLPSLFQSKHNNEEHPTRRTFLLPIFPLRKAVRFPTDNLTLNLYEPRYLALSEYVLQQENPVFGAAFASHKPQLVGKGTEPIVPVYEPGDVGALCFVKDSLDGDIPSRDGSVMRRRIRLISVAVCRFRIESIVERGSGHSSPFTIARVSCFQDDEPDMKQQFSAENIDQSLIDFAQRVDPTLDRSLLHQELLSFSMAHSDSVKRPSPSTELSLLQMTSTTRRLQALSTLTNANFITKIRSSFS